MEAFAFIFRFVKSLANFLDTPVFIYNDVDISLLDINLAFLVIGLVSIYYIGRGNCDKSLYVLWF